MGLGMPSLIGYKLTQEILNLSGHSISHCQTKGLETELLCSVESCNRHAPDGIELSPDLATALVWDNNDANAETLDGKAALYTLETVIRTKILCQTNKLSYKYRQIPRRQETAIVCWPYDIPPFRQPPKMSLFSCNADVTKKDKKVINMKPLDL